MIATTNETANAMNTIDENDLRVGDIVTWTEGYSMIIPCFARVTRRTPCMAVMSVLRTCDETDRYGQQGFCVPTDSATGEVIKARKDRKYGIFKTDGHSIRKWNGRKRWFDYCD